MSNPRQALQVIAVPAFADNYLWLIVRHGRAIAVDPGEASGIEQSLVQHHAQLEAILVTHHHSDHVGGLGALTRHHHVPVHGPARENIVGVTVPHQAGDHFEQLGLRFEVMAVPGHTLGHLAYYAPEPGWLFCGDTLFAAGCGRLFEGTPAQMLESLTRLAALPGDTQVYCAHEYTLSNLRFARHIEPHNPALMARQRREQAKRAQGLPTVPTTIAEERATNPFLRCNEPELQQALSAHTPHTGEARNALMGNALATFTALRQWKDRYQ